MKAKVIRGALPAATMLGMLLVLISAPAGAQTPFYQGKTITLVYGRAP